MTDKTKEKPLTRAEKDDLILSALQEIQQSIKDLSGKIETTNVQLPENHVELSVERPMQTLEPEQPRYPVPMDYRAIVDTVLNKNFGIRVNPKSDAPQFEFIIEVPEKYSTVSKEYIRMYGSDLRPRVLNYAEGATGVKEWTDRVFDSFDLQMKSLIVADRQP